MNEPLTITTERVDDIPLLLAQMQRMGLVELLDKHFPTHGNRVGLSLGWVTALWLTHVLSQADHRMNRVQSWAEQRLSTLRGCSDARLSVRDLSDDRLADVLRDLSDDRRWREFEQDLTGRVPPRLIAIAWHRDRYRSPAARAFVETAREVCGELQEETLAA